jgi:acyl-coenzyme A synthetase/AMP-(fatty) acid ligase
MLHIFLSNRPDDIRYGSTGKPVPGYELMIVDESGHQVADGEPGELVVRGPSAADGYWNQREKSRRTFRGEWTHTGDTYTRDADKYYRYNGRSDDMLKVGGIWVSPFEVEEALIGHPAVLEAAVVGQPDEDRLIKPKAYVVLQEGARGDDPVGLTLALQEHVKAKIGVWKYPRWIEFREVLPKTATGKIQRFRLRGDAAARNRSRFRVELAGFVCSPGRLADARALAYLPGAAGGALTPPGPLSLQADTEFNLEPYPSEGQGRGGFSSVSSWKTAVTHSPAAPRMLA